ncbi:hypothetical protein CARN8_2440003 [mine drainage metagenome]|uniref:Uncharacterized protein n=1 Tax=mine drainage metagenome TaxID=410659 RepID=A0A3P3ZMY6_9ZZZZ
MCGTMMVKMRGFWGSAVELGGPGMGWEVTIRDSEGGE